MVIGRWLVPGCERMQVFPGVNAMTASLAFEYGEQNIRINAIATGGTEAPARLIPRNNNPQTEQEKIWYRFKNDTPNF